MSSTQDPTLDTPETPVAESADVVRITSAIETLLASLPKGKALVEAATAMVVSIERGLRLRPGLTPARRKRYQEKVASVGDTAIERVAVMADQGGGKVLDVNFRPDATRASLEYARAAIPLAQRCVEMGTRVEDDGIQEGEQAAERTLVVVGTMRKRAKFDPSLLNPLHDIETSRPPKRVRKKKPNGKR